MRTTERASLVAGLHARNDAPILVVADTRDDDEVVASLDAGAADVIPALRPLDLVARVQAAFRRRPPLGVVSDPSLDGLRVDETRRLASVSGRRLALTAAESAAGRDRRPEGEIVDHWKLLRAAWADPRRSTRRPCAPT